MTFMTAEEIARLETVRCFLFKEAELLDSGQFNDWNNLLAEDVTYYVPEAEFVDRPNRSLDNIGAHHFSENKHSISNRVAYLTSGLNTSDLPRSRRVRLITNVHIIKAIDDNIDVGSSFLLMQYRWDGSEVSYAGKRVDRLRETAAGLRLVKREVDLLNVILPRSITTFF